MQLSNKIKLGSGESIGYIINGTSSASLQNLNKYLKFSEVKAVLGENTIYPRYRIFVLNNDETVRYQIDNADVLDGGSYNENYQNGARRTLSFSLNNFDNKYTPSINNIWVDTKIKLEIGLEVPDENITLWFKKGVYTISSANPSKEPTSKTVSFSCGDKFNILTGKTGSINETTEIPSGTEIKQIIQDILWKDIGNGEILDPMPFFYHPYFEGRVTPIKIPMSAGSNDGDLLLQIADILSAEIFYDSDGRLNIIPIADTMFDDEKPNLYDYNISNMQNEEFSLDFNSFVNCIYVVGANVNGHICSAIKKNENPLSPISVDRIGLRVGEIINDSNITTDELAEERAEYELRKQTIAKASISSSVMFNPILNVNNIVTVTDEDDFGLKKDRFLLQSISTSLNYDGKMNLTMSNTNNLPFVYR